MKPLRTRLQEARLRLGLPWEALERDYLLSWILAGVAELKTVENTWHQWLGPLVPNLPSCRTVMEELRPEVAALLNSNKN